MIDVSEPMCLWRVTLRHDEGTVRLVTAAKTADRAVEIICAAELAPPSAVASVEPVDNERGSASYTVAIGMLLAGLAYIAAHVVVWAWSLASAVQTGVK